MLESYPVKNGLPHSEMPGFERTEHPHIVRVPGIGGGEPIIEDTRISVRLIATYYKAGDTAEDILRDYPQLSLAAIHDAISYYLDHADEIETLIESHKIETVLAREGLRMNEAGIIYHPDDKSQPCAKQLDFFLQDKTRTTLIVICVNPGRKEGIMNVVTVPVEEKILNELLEQARDEGLILQSANGQRFLLISIENWMSFDVGDAEDFAEEVKSTGENQELMKFLAERRRDKSRIPLAEVKEELGIE